MIYHYLKRIEKKLEGNEYFANGVSYCIGFDALDKNLPLEDSVKQQLVEYKVIHNSEKIELKKIDDFKSDIERILLEWHLGGEIINEITRILGSDINLYQCIDDTGYDSYGSVCSIFRVIENVDESILIEVVPPFIKSDTMMSTIDYLMITK